jgi:hypothetical protein
LAEGAEPALPLGERARREVRVAVTRAREGDVLLGQPAATRRRQSLEETSIDHAGSL